MALIEIDTPKSVDGQPVAGYGTIVKMDGSEVKDVRSIRVDIGVDEAITVGLEVLAIEHFAFTAGADVHISAVVMPGYQLIAETLPDGRTSYRAEAE